MLDNVVMGYKGKRKKCLLSPRRWGCWRCAASGRLRSRMPILKMKQTRHEPIRPSPRGRTLIRSPAPRRDHAGAGAVQPTVLLLDEPVAGMNKQRGR